MHSKSFQTKNNPNSFMRVRNAAAIVLVFLSVSWTHFRCNLPENTTLCEQFKKGRFLIPMKTEEFETTYEIRRDDSIQTELDTRTGRRGKFSIKWTNPCKYELRLIESSSIDSDSLLQLMKRTPLHVEILTTGDDYYTFESRFKEYIYRDTCSVAK